MRSPRAQMIAEWVNSIIKADAGEARRILEKFGEFPLVMTRDINVLRRWLQGRVRREVVEASIRSDGRRCGLVASSENKRLRAYGIEVSAQFRKGIEYAEWYLAPPADVRSSCQLEVPATEFDCQGLELDWVGVC